MVGSYQMTTGSGSNIDVAVPAFSLDSPHSKPRFN
jgi:ApaG protein